jgi:hypothetical protein
MDAALRTLGGVLGGLGGETPGGRLDDEVERVTRAVGAGRAGQDGDPVDTRAVTVQDAVHGDTRFSGDGETARKG